MCVIMVLPAGVMVPWDMFKNATWNNEDGYGILVKDGDKLELFKDCPENGNDPDAIYKILDQHKNLERYIHLRHKTEGAIAIHNTQPFCAYKSNKREVWFMHNGTLHDMRPGASFSKANLSSIELEGQDLSDSNIFNQRILRPVFQKVGGMEGKGDIQDPFVQNLINKYWSMNSRGILISSDQDPFIIERPSWEKISSDQGEFLASNKDYFDNLKRGREFERRKKEEEERKKKEVTSNSFRESRAVEKAITSLFCNRFNANHNLSEKVVNILEEVDLYSEQGMCDFANLTYEEVLAFVKSVDPDDIAGFLIHLADLYKGIFNKLEDVENKKKLGEKKIESLVIEIDKLTKSMPQGEVHVG